MMQVTLIPEGTSMVNPEAHIGRMAAICYDSNTSDEACVKRATKCKDSGHLATMRFAFATFIDVIEVNSMQPTITLRAVGGVFSPIAAEQRGSGYFRKLMVALERELGRAVNLAVSNGGSMAELDGLVRAEMNQPSDAVIWMADIPNTEEKRLPELSAVWRGSATYLVQSKNNDGNRYTDDALFTRMLASGAELLLEVTRRDTGVSGTLLSLGGHRTGAFMDIDELAEALAAAIISGFPAPPLNVRGGTTMNGMSYQNLHLHTATEVPLIPHPGAFGVVRKHHIHEGVDLYTEEGHAVLAMEAGKVVAILPFTGPQIGMPWWHDTHCVMIEGSSGVLNYGEIIAASQLRVGQGIRKGQLIGNVAQVLREDKGRPMSMLHVERYVTGTKRPIDAWRLGTSVPGVLLDPTGILRRSYRNSAAIPKNGATDAR
jgi:hypothetical protein